MPLILVSFVAGILTVLAPCVLPLLPIIVGGSLSGNPEETHKRRAFIVTASLGVSVLLFTFLLKVSTLFIAVPESFWKWVSGGIILFFGLVTIFPKIWESIPFVSALNRSSNKSLGAGFQKKSVWGDIIVGASLGPVFSTCSPTYFLVLATVLPVSLALGVTYLLSYTIGLCLSLLAIAFVGQKIVGKLGFAADPNGSFKKVLGVIFLIVGIAIITGADKRFEARILSAGFFDVTTVEQKLIGSSSQDPTLKPEGNANPTTTTTEVASSDTNKEIFMTPEQKRFTYPLAPELVNPDGYINTNGKPITIESLRGKVVLVDFWTYSCINCQRTLPYVTAWYDKYEKDGLVVIGVHTPEFSFEKVQSNVEDAVKRFGIKYPVILDNNYKTWGAYKNQFWPHKYLIDIDGRIVYDHIGEGSYDETERQVQRLLRERAQRLQMDTTISNSISNPTGAVNINDGMQRSPETYFGANRNEFLGNGTPGKTGIMSLMEPITVDTNTLYLIGEWNIKGEYAETGPTVGSPQTGSDRVDYHYMAKNLYFVAGTSGKIIDVEVLRDGKPVDAKAKGKDIFYKNGKSFVSISTNRLYSIIEDKAYGDHLLEFIISDPGLQAFTFTFG